MKKSTLFLVWLMSVFFFFSCKKQKDSVEENTPVLKENEALVLINIQGIQANENTNLFASVNIPNKNTDQIDRTYSYINGYGFDSYSTEEKYAGGGKASIKNSNKPDIKKSAATTLASGYSPMKDGRKYMLVLYKVDGTNLLFREAKEFTTGIENHFIVAKGDTYRWYAYTYNHTDAIPVYTAGTVSIPTYTNKEFAVDNGSTFMVPIAQTTPQKITISFEQKLARVGVRIDANGINVRRFTSATVVYDNPVNSGMPSLELYMGNYNLMNGTLGLNSNKLIVPNGGTIPAAFDQTDPAIYEAYFYTAAVTAPQNQWAKKFSVRLRDVKVNLHPTIEYPGGQDITVISGTSATIFNFKGFSDFEEQKSSIGYITIGSAGAPIGPLIWSLGNLYYEDGLYRFRSDGTFNYFNDPRERPQDFIRDYGKTDYWFWMSRYPDEVRPDFRVDRVDPCALVSPAGTWSMPTEANFRTLNTLSNGGANRTITRRQQGSGNRRSVQYVEGVYTTNDPVWTNGTKPVFTFKFDGRWQAAASNIPGFSGSWSENLAYENYSLFWTKEYFPNNSQSTGSRAANTIYMTHYARHDGTTINFPQALSDPLAVRRYQIRCVRPNPAYIP